MTKHSFFSAFFFVIFLLIQLSCNNTESGFVKYDSRIRLFEGYHQISIGAAAFIKQKIAEMPPKIEIDYSLDSLAGILSGSIQLSGNGISEKLLNLNKMFLDSIFNKVRIKRINKMSVWAKNEIPQTKTIFYPFSGPDLLNVVTLFPDAETYYLLALEPIGTLPSINVNDTAQINGYFSCLTQSLQDILKKSYFITRRMNEHLACDNLQGVLPLLSFFIKRSDMEIVSINKVKIDSAGNENLLNLSEVTGNRRPVGIKIEVLNKLKKLQTIYYYSCDLGNASFYKGVPFYEYVSSNIPDCSTYIKAASYLMHYGTFTNIRNLILEKSKLLLQDDTGIPVRNIILDNWQYTLYGKYVKPVKDFTNVEQKDLYLLYKLDSSDVKPLPFDLGYHWGTRENNLMRCVRR